MLARNALGCDLSRLGAALASARVLTADDARKVALTALKIHLSRRFGAALALSDASLNDACDDDDVGLLELEPSSLALALAEVLEATSSAEGKSGGKGATAAAALAADKHEKALAQHVVSPRDIGVSYDAIGGLEEAKEALREAITYPLKYPQLYREGVAKEAVKGVLLFGPPGQRFHRVFLVF